jgi:hypothetical protein
VVLRSPDWFQGLYTVVLSVNLQKDIIRFSKLHSFDHTWEIRRVYKVI